MNRVVVNVPDDKMQAFEEALRGLGLERKYEPDIPADVQKMVLERIANHKQGDGVPWDEAMRRIQFGK